MNIQKIGDRTAELLNLYYNNEIEPFLNSCHEDVLWIGPADKHNIINLRLDITHLYYPAKNSFQKGRLKRREIFTELLLYTLTT